MRHEACVLRCAVLATFDYGPVDRRPSVSGGQLPGAYQFEQLHFHWGAVKPTQQSGSEHIVDGVRSGQGRAAGRTADRTWQNMTGQDKAR